MNGVSDTMHNGIYVNYCLILTSEPVNTDATVASTASKERLQSRSCSTSNQHQPLAGKYLKCVQFFKS